MLMGAIFLLAVGIPEWIKATLVMIPFSFLIIDVISWWLTKLNPEFAWFTLIGGYGYSLASTAMLFISLYQMWILPWKLAKKHNPATNADKPAQTGQTPVRVFTMRMTPNKSKAEPVPSKPANAKPPDIASASVPDTLAALHVDPDIGLTHAEVDIRRKEHGYNEVTEKQRHPVLMFLGKFWGLSAWMLELIMVLSAVLGKFSDLAVVGALLVVNAVLSFMQEHRAAGVVETLRRRLQVSARVRREASWQVIPARDLVPGDIVRVRPGDIIPADVKLLTGALSIDQSALTGESKDADKEIGDVLSSGSVVRRGEGNGVVMLTGAKTYFGRTTELVQQARPKLHIEAVVAKVVFWLFVIVGALLGVVIVLSLMRGAPLLEMVPLMLVLLMSAVPVALPAMFTVSMAVGSKELAKRGVLVTRLSAAEDAATMDVLCVDKTGTITMNQLAVTGVIPLEHASESDVLFAGALASQEANQDPIDLAFLVAAKERHIIGDGPAVTPVSFTPFDAKNRRTEAVVELPPQITKRAYELCEQRGRRDDRAVQDRGPGVREIRKDESPDEPTRTSVRRECRKNEDENKIVEKPTEAGFNESACLCHSVFLD